MRHTFLVVIANKKPSCR